MATNPTDSVAFVQETPIPASPPPVAETGVVNWMRANLFSSIPNGILTVLSFIAIYYILALVIPWAWGGVWDTQSLSGCRDVFNAGWTAGLLDRVAGLNDAQRMAFMEALPAGTEVAAATGAELSAALTAAEVRHPDAPFSAACFSVLSERWNQLLFGFSYPQDQYWRPATAFVLLFVAAAPVLFYRLPRILLVFTGIYPFLAYWLIWGGSIWVPIVAAIGFAVGYFVYAALVNRSFAAGFIGGVAAAFLFWGILAGPITSHLGTGVSLILIALNLAGAYLIVSALKSPLIEGLDSHIKWPALAAFVMAWVGLLAPAAAGQAEWLMGGTDSSTWFLEAVPSRDLGGFMLNMILGVTCVSLSLPLGIALALGRQSDLPIIKYICVCFIEFIRGVPLITLLFVANVILAFFFPPESSIDLIVRVIIMITLFSAAYIAEVIRGGLAALPTGQYEAADSLGLDYPQAMRLIILPQALKISIPGIVNVAVGLFKDTVLVSIISMFDLIGMIRGPVVESVEWKGIYWELFLFASVLFFIICFGISKYSQWLERQLATDHR